MGKAWWVALAMSAAAIAAGAYLGEATQVFLNAASICLACMGIG